MQKNDQDKNTQQGTDQQESPAYGRIAFMLPRLFREQRLEPLIIQRAAMPARRFALVIMQATARAGLDVQLVLQQEGSRKQAKIHEVSGRLPMRRTQFA
ncbi:MAG: hypothetical protein K2Q19_08275 [Rhodocyclaceae bacterium]|nr:hypothetical protein [Rhodocyclaceae bacterium]